MPVPTAELSKNGEAAMTYASHGWAVFPLHTPTETGCSCSQPTCGNAGKHPRTARGFKEATTSATTIRLWWTKWPEANIGIATGAAAGFVVLDVDPKNRGDESLVGLCEQHGDLPSTIASITGSGGQHLLFADPGELRNSSNKVGPGLDVRADGGYIVAPPSLHRSGDRYRWDACSGPEDLALAAMPGWLLDRAKRKLQPVRLPLDNDADILRRASAYLAKIPGAVSGDGGHNATFKAALAMVRGFSLSGDVALDLLIREYNPRCQPQWSRGDLARKVANADQDAKLPQGYLLDKKDPSPDDPITDPSWERQMRCTASGDPKPTYGNIVLVLQNAYLGRITYSEMQSVAHLDGKLLNDKGVGEIRYEMERRWRLVPAKEPLWDAINHVAHERPVHPVRDYLNGLKWDSVERLDQVHEEILHCDAEQGDLASRMLRKFFIAAVARAFKPGCQADTSLILQGPQGAFKSTFFRVLAGEWFSDTPIDISNKDAYLQLAEAWIYEWAEIESVIGKHWAPDIKRFMTSGTDTFRPPYGRGIIKHARQGVIVGTSNQTDLLTDSTGSRRFWIIRCGHVDIEKLKAMRDQLWAEATAAYRNGEQHWLTDAEEAERVQDAEQHEVEDPWLETISQWLEGSRSRGLLVNKGYLTSTDILSLCLKLDADKHSRAHQTRVGVALNKLCWPKRRIRINGARLWGYLAPESFGLT